MQILTADENTQSSALFYIRVYCSLEFHVIAAFLFVLSLPPLTKKRAMSLFYEVNVMMSSQTALE